jgi:hypothetical protein
VGREKTQRNVTPVTPKAKELRVEVQLSLPIEDTG